MSVPQWLKWAREIQSSSQTGLTFAHNEYDVERNKRLAEIAAEIIDQYSTLGKQELYNDFLNQPGYATPKVDVRAAIVKAGKILLVKESQDGRWCMPGGWADVGETPAESVIREVWEESGYRVKPTKLIGVYDANRSGRPLNLYHAFKVIFLCDLKGGAAKTGFETLAVEFFDFDALPDLSQNRTHADHLLEVRAHLDDPHRQTFFD